MKDPKVKKLCTVCDSVYFKEFAPALINSVEKLNKTKLVVVVINPNKENKKFIQDSNYKNTEFHTIVDDRNHRSFYASARFIFSEVLLSNLDVDGLFFIDTDCLVLKEMQFPSSDYALFLRDPLPGTVGLEKEGTNVAAGAVYIDRKGIEFASAISQSLNEVREDIWFIDQIILWRAHNHFKQNSDLSFEQIDKKYIDWEFVDDSVIWTGKGSRKYSNEKFVKALGEYRK